MPRKCKKQKITSRQSIAVVVRGEKDVDAVDVVYRVDATVSFSGATYYYCMPWQKRLVRVPLLFYDIKSSELETV